MASAMSLSQRAMSWSVGDAVPVNYMKDQKAPAIKEDAAYPDWVLTLAEPLQTKTQLLNKVSFALLPSPSPLSAAASTAAMCRHIPPSLQSNPHPPPYLLVQRPDAGQQDALH